MRNKIAIVITLTKKHIHYCKALLASFEYYNPNIPIIVLKDGEFRTNFLKKRKNVNVVNSKDVNKIHNLDIYVLLNKLNIFYLPQMGYDFDYFIHFDADSILTNTINFERIINGYDFCIFQGNLIDGNDNISVKNMNHYAFNPIDFPEYKFNQNQLYFFSSSHIAISKEIISRLIAFFEKHRFEINKEFINDKRIRFQDQGFLNLAVNYFSYNEGLKVRLEDIGIYGYQKENEFPGLTLENINKKVNTGVAFIHYTGSSRKAKMKAHNFGNILDFFLKRFYNNLFLYFSNEAYRLSNFYFMWFAKRLIGKIRYFNAKISDKLQNNQS